MAAATAMLDVTYTIPSWAGSGVPPGGEPFNVIGGLYNVLIIGAGNINFGLCAKDKHSRKNTEQHIRFRCRSLEPQFSD